MSVDEEARYRLHQSLQRAIGDREAATLMAMLPPGGWENVASKDDIRRLEAATKDDIRHLRGELRQLEGRMETRFEAMGSRMEAMESRLEARTTRTILAVNIPSIMAAVGLAFAAARLG